MAKKSRSNSSAASSAGQPKPAQTKPAQIGTGTSQPVSNIASEPTDGAGLPVSVMKEAVGSLTLGRIISVGALMLAIVVIGVLFFRVMASFFVPLFLAALLVVIFRPLYQAILDRVDGRTHIASILTTLSILLLVLFPAGIIASIAAAQGADFFRQMNSGGLYQSLDQIRTRLSLDLPRAEQFRKLDSAISQLADPESTESNSERLAEAEEIAIYLTDVLGGPRKVVEGGGKSSGSQVGPNLAEQTSGDQTAEAIAEESPSLASVTIQSPQTESFLEALRVLRELAQQIASENDQRDPIQRQTVREQYQQQYWVVRSAQRVWMRSLIGDSINAQLKLLANPSETELKSFLAGAQEYLQPRVLPFTQMAGRFLFQIFIDFGILIITLYFFFADGPSMIRTLMRLSPLDDEYEERLLRQFDSTSRAVVLATVLSALAQGVLATGAFWILGMPSLVLLFLATTFMAFIPFLGPAAVWAPVAIYLGVFEGRWPEAIGLTIFGVTVVAMVDNAVRMFVLQGNSQLHPLLALLSVLGGLQVFGPVGILVGPMVVVFLQTLLEILNHELSGQANAAESNSMGDSERVDKSDAAMATNA
ncbi:MAG TPA: permease [Planctomycetaceae bacterium]|nr:permease [Planctomycetaceae bacterium]